MKHRSVLRKYAQRNYDAGLKGNYDAGLKGNYDAGMGAIKIANLRVSCKWKVSNVVSHNHRWTLCNNGHNGQG